MAECSEAVRCRAVTTRSCPRRRSPFTSAASRGTAGATRAVVTGDGRAPGSCGAGAIVTAFVWAIVAFVPGAFAPVLGIALLATPVGELMALYGSTFVLRPLAGGDVLALVLFGAFLGWLGAQLSVSLSLRQLD